MEEQPEKKNYKQLVLGALIGLIVSLIGIFVQSLFDKQGRKDQLYLDEKKDFVLACDDYLKQYSQWHDLMDYCVYNDTFKVATTTVIDDKEEFIKLYRKWRQNLDFGYSKIFLLSNNEFGIKTMKVSTALHVSLDSLLYGDYKFETRKAIQQRAEYLFFKNWLQVAQEEIFKYNSGDRDQKLIHQFQIEERDKEITKTKNDSIDEDMHQSLSKASKYIQGQDSLNGKKPCSRMPTKEELKKTINSLNEPH